jgi:hypothetical protein
MGRLVLAATISLSAATVLSAQDTSRVAPRQWRNVVSVNPLLIPVEYVSGEFERMVSGLVSTGLGASYFGIGDNLYATVEAKLRFYLNEEAPRGFSIGFAGGITRVDDGDSFSGSAVTRPTIAVIADYNWLIGKGDRFVVGTGVGTKRILGVGDDDFDAPIFYPTLRFQIGVRY